jgi:hypothetical protein
MKMSIKKTEVMMMAKDKSAGKPIRSQTISDTYGMGKPSRTAPMGGFMSMQCFSASPDQRMSPTSKPGNAGKKRIV